MGAYVHTLRGLPEQELMVSSDEQFSVLRNGVADPVNTFRWCWSCKLWRPPKVSHCPECKRCFWRFDHHCFLVGNCVAVRNHSFFALFLLSGVVGWVASIVAVASRLAAHSELSFLSVWWPPRIMQFPLYMSIIYI